MANVSIITSKGTNKQTRTHKQGQNLGNMSHLDNDLIGATLTTITQ
jgi:hypothetical protein